MIPFKPVVEEESAESFLPDSPINIIKTGKAANVPIVIGFNDDDAAFKTSRLYIEFNYF